MGIDIYMRWDGQTEEEEQAQYTGFDTRMGRVGYLREAYHGGPYATKELLPETWSDGAEGDWDERGVHIPAATLRERLPATLLAVEERYRNIYDAPDEDIREAQKSFIDFVDLYESLERKGKNPRVINSY